VKLSLVVTPVLLISFPYNFSLKSSLISCSYSSVTNFFPLQFQSEVEFDFSLANVTINDQRPIIQDNVKRQNKSMPPILIHINVYLFFSSNIYLLVNINSVQRAVCCVRQHQTWRLHCK
jgi:hypothetical protein